MHLTNAGFSIWKLGVGNDHSRALKAVLTLDIPP